MLLDIVKKIVSEQGEQILSDPKRVNAFFSDLAREEPKPQKRAIIECLEPKHGVVKILKDVTKEERTNYKESLAKRLRIEERLDIELYREAIDIICITLFGEKPEPVVEVKTEHIETSEQPIQLPNNNYFTDPRDGKKYKTVKIGDQIWMAENLNYNAPGNKCHNNDPKNAEKYGRLYNWETAMKVCPPGWHLPTNKEWNELIQIVGGEKIAGKHLKAKYGWNDYEGNSCNGLDAYDFAALPGGYGFSNGNFSTVGHDGIWWSASEYNASNAYYWYMNYGAEGADYSSDDKSRCLFSIRCLQNKA